MKANCVFSGGGILGISFAGAMAALEKHRVEIENVAGSSAGAIIAGLTSAGYTASEIKDAFMSTDFRRFINKPRLNTMKLAGLILKCGMHKVEPLEEWINALLVKKGIRTFADLEQKGRCPLKVTASDINQKLLAVFPDDLPKYDQDMCFPVAKAITISASIPFFFRPHALKDSLLVDGGLMSNYPVWIFDATQSGSIPIIGFKLVDTSKIDMKYKQNIVDFSKDVMQSVLSNNEERFLPASDNVHTVTIDTMGYSAVDFDMDKETQMKLYMMGYHRTDDFMWSIS